MKTRIPSTARLSFPLASALAALLTAQSATAADGTWLGASGNWTDTGTWSGGTLADGTGFTANFTGVDIAADQTITLAADRTIGNITFTDATTASNNLLITGGNLLTLDVTSGAPVINVTNQTLTINSQIAGTDGLQKSGAGALTLNGSAGNTFTGGLNVTRGTLTLDYANLATPTDLVAATNTLQLTNGALALTGKNVAAATTAQTFANTTLNGRNNFVVAKGALATSATLNLGQITVTTGSVTAFSPTTAWTTTASLTERVFITAGGSVPTLPGSGSQFINGVFIRAAAAAGQARWAAVNSGGQLLAGTALTALAATTNDSTTPNQLNASDIVFSTTTANSYGLLLNGNSNPRSITLAANGTYTLNSVIQQQATNGVSINAGTGTSNIIIGSERNLVLNMDNSAGLTFNAPIANNGAGVSSVTIASTAPSGTTPGNIAFNSANTYTGATNVANSTLFLGNANALATTSAVTLGGISAATLSSSGDATGISIPAPITAANAGVTSTIAYGRNTSAQGSMTLSGGITGGGGNVTFTTTSANSGGNLQTIVLGGAVGSAGGWGGSTTLSCNSNNAMTLRSGIANALPTTTVLTFAQNTGAGTGRATTFDLNGNNQTLAGLSNTGNVPDSRNMTVNSTNPATLTINNTANFTFGGRSIFSGTTTQARITGAISLTKNGAGTFTLGGTLVGGAGAIGNIFTGNTTVLGGILVLGESLSIQSSAFNTAGSVTGDATNGLQTALPALTLGGLTGNKNFATVFTTSGGYAGLTALTLNPGSGVTHTYSADIGNGAGALNLIKSGAGTQILAAAQSYTGTTTGSAGVLLATQAAALSGYNVPGKVIFNGGTIAVQVGGGAWTAGEVDTLVANATKTSGSLGIDTTTGSLVQSTSFTAGTFGSTLGLNKLGANDLTLDQANTYTGPTTVTAGTLTLTNANALQNSALVTTGAGTVTLGSGTSLNLGGLSGATGNLATVISNYSTITNLTLNAPTGAFLSYGGIIADGVPGMTVTKTGAGAQALTGANTYTGATQINDGILTFGNKASKTAATATAAAAGSVGLGVHNSTATFYSAVEVGSLFNSTLSGFSLDTASGVAIDTTNAGGSFDQNVALTASRALTKLGTGTLILSTVNSHASTTLSGGVLRANTSNSALGSGTLTINNTALQLQVSDGLTLANNITIDALAAGSGTGGQGLIQNTGTGNATLTGGTITINAIPGAGGHFASVSTGTLTVADPINSTVNVSVRLGTVIFSGGGSYSSMSGSQGTVRLGATNGLSTSATLTIGAATSSFDLAGFNQTLAGLTKATGGVATVGNSSTANDSLLTTTGTSIFDGVIQDVLGSGTRKVALTVNGGNLTLSGANTYTGATAVTAGTLAVSGSLGATAVTVSSAATLAGNGNIGGDVTIQSGATHALAVAATPGAQVTRAITGTLTLTAGNLLNLTAAATPAAGEYVLATATTAISGSPTTINYNGISGTVTVDTVSSPNRLLLTVSASSNYASWANDPLKGNIPGEPAGGDFDNDGITNIVEYALGQNPRVSSQPAGILSGNTITYTKGADAIANGDVSWVIETSQTLDAGSWTPVVTQPPANPALTIAYTFTPSTPVKNFARLKVTQLP